MQQRTAVDEDLAFWGLVPDGEVRLADAPAEYHLWPEHLPAWNTFHALRTQWRQGFGGASGLDYTAVATHLEKRLRLRGRKFNDMYDALQHLEAGVLQGMAERSREQQGERGAAQ